MGTHKSYLQTCCSYAQAEVKRSKLMKAMAHQRLKVQFKVLGIYIILLYPDERRPTTLRSNDTLVDTPFQLISGFFHVNQGILCSEHAEQASSRGVLERGGGQQPEVD